MANRKLYASGRSRQKAQQAKRTQPRNVVTMQKPAAKAPSKAPSKPAAKAKTKRSIPKDVTKKVTSSPNRKYPTRQDGKRAKVASATSKKITKPKKRSVADNFIDGLTSVAPIPKAIRKGISSSRLGTGKVKTGYEEIHPILTRLGVTRKKR